MKILSVFLFLIGVVLVMCSTTIGAYAMHPLGGIATLGIWLAIIGGVLNEISF